MGKTFCTRCGSTDVSYVGIDDVEGNTVVELFQCEDCRQYIEVRTTVDDDDDGSLISDLEV